MNRRLKLPVTKQSKPSEVASTLRSIAANTDNPDYAGKPVSSADMVSVATEIEQKMAEVASLEAQIKQKLQEVKVLKDKGVDQVAHNGEFIYRNAGDDEAPIYRAGYLLAAVPSRSYVDPSPPKNVNAERGEGSGKLRVWCDVVTGAASYIVEVNETDPNDELGWRQVAYTSSSRINISGLTPVTKVWVRMKVLMSGSRLSSASRIQDCVVP